MKPTLCASVRPDLKALADGELALWPRLRAARHLHSCPVCQKELSFMQTLSKELEPTEADAPLDGALRERILNSVPARPLVSSEPDREVARRRRLARKKTVLALSVASLVSGLLWVGAQNSAFNSDAPPATETLSSNPVRVAGSSSSSSASALAGARSPSGKQGQATGETNSLFADGHTKALSSSSSQAQRAPSLSPPQAARRADPLGSPLPAPGSDGVVSVNGSAESVVPAERAVHREGSLSVAVENAESASDEAQNIIKNAGGYVANTSLETSGGSQRTATLDCRIPVAQFETVVKKIGQLGTVRAKSVSGQDITAQVAQAGARNQALSQELSIAQAKLRARENKRRKASDLEPLRADVRQARVEAAQAKAALDTLRKYGQTSSLWVSLQDGVAATPSKTSWSNSLGVGQSTTMQLFLNNARVPFQLLLLVLAYSPIWLPMLLLWRKFGRKWLAE